MPKPQKLETVKKISEKLEKSQVLVLIENRGLTVEMATKMRKNIRDSKGEVRVFKNKLLKIALRNKLHASLDDTLLKGPLLFAFGYGDPVATVKALVNYHKEGENQEKFDIKAGFLNDKFISRGDLIAFSALPPRETLLGQLLSVLNTPASNLLATMNAPAQQLLGVLGAYKHKLETANS